MTQLYHLAPVTSLYQSARCALLPAGLKAGTQEKGQPLKLAVGGPCLLDSQAMCVIDILLPIPLAVPVPHTLLN